MMFNKPEVISIKNQQELSVGQRWFVETMNFNCVSIFFFYMLSILKCYSSIPVVTVV